MATWPILSVTTFLPLVGVLFIAMLTATTRPAQRNARWVALWTTLVTFAVSLLIWSGASTPARRNSSSSRSSPGSAASLTYHMGVDGISLPFVILTTALMPLCILGELGRRSSRASRNT